MPRRLLRFLQWRLPFPRYLFSGSLILYFCFARLPWGRMEKGNLHAKADDIRLSITAKNKPDDNAPTSYTEIHSPIVNRCTTALRSQNVIVGQGEELWRRNVWLVTAVNTQVKCLVNVLLEIVKAEILALDSCDSTEILNVSVGNELFRVHVPHVPVERFAL